MDKSAIIEKVQFLLNLANAEGTPINEAEAAQNAANKLIQKFELTEDDYKIVEVKPIYTDDELLFETKELKEYLSELALACAEKFDCFVIQELNVSSFDGDTSYKYFVYGDSADIIRTKALFAFVKKEVDAVISIHTRGRGKLYIDSFCDGLIKGAKENIEHEDFHIEGLVIPSKKEIIPDEAIVPTASKKEAPPIQEKTEVNLPKEGRKIDPIAFWTGEGYGRDIHIGKIIDDLYLDNEDPRILSNIKDQIQKIIDKL
jgi:hypothetical protein